MKTRNSALYALGLAAAITFGGAVSARAQSTTTTTTTKKTTRTKRTTRHRVAPKTQIPIRKDVPQQPMAMHDTVFVTRVDTVTMRGRVDTVMATRMQYDTVMRMMYPPLAKLPGVFFGLGAGVDQPMNNINAVVKAGWAGQAQLGYFPGTSPLGLRVDATYGQFHDRDTDCARIGPCQNPKLFTAGGDVILRMPIDRTGHLNPVLYVFGGGGYAKISDVTARQTTYAGGSNGGAYFSNNNNWYYDFGPGVDFTLGGLHLYAEGKYLTINTGTQPGAVNQKNVHAFPIFGGIKFGW
jgi:hypothetical protein